MKRERHRAEPNRVKKGNGRSGFALFFLHTAPSSASSPCRIPFLFFCLFLYTQGVHCRKVTISRQPGLVAKPLDKEFRALSPAQAWACCQTWAPPLSSLYLRFPPLAPDTHIWFLYFAWKLI